MLCRECSYNQVETEFIVKSSGACSRELGFNFEATGCEDDAEGDPKSAV